MYPLDAPEHPARQIPSREELREVDWQNASPSVLIFALAVVCLGVLLLAPGLGIIMAIVLVVPFIRTMAVFRRRLDAGRPTSTAESIGMFIGSTIVAFIVLSVVAAAAFGTFCLTCLGAAAATQGSEISIVIAGGATLIVVGAVGYGFFKWIRSRWHEDLHR